MSTLNYQLQSLQLQLETIGRFTDLQQSDRYSHADTETASMMLEQAARFSEEHLMALAATGDIAGCKLEKGRVTLPTGTRDSYQAWCELGFPLLSLPPEHDGLDFPMVLQCAVQDLMDGANLAFGMMAINLRCAVTTLIKHAPKTLADEWLPKLTGGEAASTIAISEPQAGSDAGRIRASASLSDQGEWSVSGTKIWISYADHDATDNILHLVLARVPGGLPGTRGLGLFAVPARIDDNSNGVVIARLEEKMGLHASPTCVVEFSNASATLLGEPDEGIRNLFSMMNAMRLSVGVQGAATACTATSHAVQYALERTQGGRPDEPPLAIACHADVQRMLMSMTATSELLRAFALKTASFLDFDSLSDKPGQSHWKQLAELMLPMTKTLGAELGFEVVNTGIQVMGGYGYTSDYPLERMARDLRVASIYEGTSGIQALDLVKRKILADKGTVLESLFDIIETDLSNADAGNPLIAGVSAGLKSARELLAWLLATAETDPKGINASCYPALRLLGLLCMAWNGLSLYAAARGNTPFEKNIRAALVWFGHHHCEEYALWFKRASAPFPGHDFVID